MYKRQGAIDHTEAKRRRELELAETNFFGSLDGVSKFVKGDAVAGLLITGLNLVMGLIMGVVFHDMPFGEAFETYSILTVGDGLVSQIPAVIISVAAALLLSRGGSKGAADVSFFAQLSRYPGALGTVGVLMALLAIVPGMPFVPFMLSGAVMGYLAWRTAKIDQKAQIAEIETTAPPPPKNIGDLLDFDEIHVEFSPDLVSMVLDPVTGLETRIANMRNYVATSFGLILPEMRLTDDATLPSSSYRIRLQGVETARDRLMADRVLVLLADGIIAPDGLDAREPVYGAPARWIRPDVQEDAALAGLTVVYPAEVLATHLLEIIKGNLARLLSVRGLRRLLDEFATLSDPARAASNRRLLDEMIPEKVPADLLLAVLKLLLEERVSIRNLPLILESIAEARSLGLPEAICEHVRQRLGFQLVAELKRADGSIPLIQLAAEWEKLFLDYQIDGERGQRDVALPPEQFNKLASGIAERLNRAGESGNFPALVTSTLRRRFLRTVMAAKGISAPVLSYEEIGMSARPAMLGVVAP